MAETPGSPDSKLVHAPWADEQSRRKSNELPATVFRAELVEIKRRRGPSSPPKKVEGDPETDPAPSNPPPPTPHPDHGLVGLAISGGGIRSATFALGLCQRLAREGLLGRFDYLSTVSGGGYLGSSLSWLLSRPARDDAEKGGEEAAEVAGKLDLDDNFPYGREDPEDQGEPRDAEWQGKMLRYLREHGNYLTPGGSITILSAVGVLLRGLFLNLLVWLPILVAALVVLFWVHLRAASLDFPLAPPDPALDWPETVCCESCKGAECVVEAAADRALSQWPLYPALLIALGIVGVFLVFCIVYSLVTCRRRKRKAEEGNRKWNGYVWRRRFEGFCHGWLLVMIGLLLLGSLPVVARALGAEVAERGSVVAVLLGLVSGLASFFQAGRDGGGNKSRLPLGLIATAGAALLLYGVLFLAYRLAFFYFAPDPLVNWKWILLGALVIAFVTGYFVNLNSIGLHRFYRDRLTETFMPGVRQALHDETGPTRAGDMARMSELKGDQHKGPYHLIDTNVVLVNSEERRYRMRGGDSFILSPCYCGSNATDYLPTEAFMDDQMTLATAMAISGAAANPNTGAGGTGPTRTKAVSLLMALLNVRLGYWIPHPKTRQKARTPSHFRAMFYEIFPTGYREAKAYLQLSDGGHFENLALYELVRRKCQVILVLDGAADPGFAFGDLQVATRRIAADFGALVEWDKARPFEAMIPKLDAEYPQGTKVAERGHALATIRYASGGTSTLVYVKSTMVRGLSLRVRGYKGSHDTFPDQSTADQFFEEEQFEAYRDLGYQLGTNLLADPVVNLGRRIERARET